MIISGGRFSELHPIYPDCRAPTFALARLSCWLTLYSVLLAVSGGERMCNTICYGTPQNTPLTH